MGRYRGAESSHSRQWSRHWTHQRKFSNLSMGWCPRRNRLRYEGMRQAILENFGIRNGHQTLGVGIEYDQGGSSAATTRSTFRNIIVDEAAMSMRICNLGNNCDFTTYDNISFGHADPTVTTNVSGEYGL